MISERLLTAYLKYATRKLSRLQAADGTALPPPRPQRRYLLYAHVPFCESLCPYCSFNRFVFEEKLARQYFADLRQEMRIVAGLGYRFPSMYIGGGTPTILVEELCETIDLARSLLGVKEVSCETNPNHLNDTIAKRLQGRVQRLSVGVQSFDDDLLRQMQRLERFGSGKAILARIQAYASAFPSFNVDMIFNLPGQSAESLQRDADMVLRSTANQTTFYPLMTSYPRRSGCSPAVGQQIRREAGLPPSEKEARFYFLLTRRLAGEYLPASAWTFSRRPSPLMDRGSTPFILPGGSAERTDLIDEYIVDYDDYLGVGSGAFSYLNGSLYVNTFSLQEYRRLISQGRTALTALRRYSRRDQMRYFYMMRLFGLKLDKQHFRKAFGVALERGLWLETLFMRFFAAYQQDDGRWLTLTPTGRYLMVVMMREFFTSVNYLRQQARQHLPVEERALIH